MTRRTWLGFPIVTGEDGEFIVINDELTVPTSMHKEDVAKLVAEQRPNVPRTIGPKVFRTFSLDGK